MFTGFALIAFASNSLLCRMALGPKVIDAAGFTTLRLISGAVVLWVLTANMQRREAVPSAAKWFSALLLFSYAAAFSFAFVSLTTGTGALILFGTVQATMFIGALFEGSHPGLPVYGGLLMAAAGMIYLVLPGLTAPPLWGALLMALAGTSWGVYSLRGRGAVNPIAATRDNFFRTVPFALVIAIVFYPDLQISPKGVLLAVASGGLASAAGYIVWFAALQDLHATHAAMVQLLAPVMAAGGGIIFLSEPLTSRLVISGVLILGGIALAISYPSLVKRTTLNEGEM